MGFLGFLWKAWGSLGRLRVPWGRIKVPWGFLELLSFLGILRDSFGFFEHHGAPRFLLGFLGGFLGFLREAWGSFGRIEVPWGSFVFLEEA